MKNDVNSTPGHHVRDWPYILGFACALWIIGSSSVSTSFAFEVIEPKPESADFFERLGLRVTTGEAISDQEIKKAYRRASLKFHPDMNKTKGVDTTEHFKRINEANSALSSEMKRAEYWRYGQTRSSNTGSKSGSSNSDRTGSHDRNSNSDRAGSSGKNSNSDQAGNHDRNSNSDRAGNRGGNSNSDRSRESANGFSGAADDLPPSAQEPWWKELRRDSSFDNLFKDRMGREYRYDKEQSRYYQRVSNRSAYEFFDPDTGEQFYLDPRSNRFSSHGTRYAHGSYEDGHSRTHRSQSSGAASDIPKSKQDRKYWAHLSRSSHDPNTFWDEVNRKLYRYDTAAQRYYRFVNEVGGFHQTYQDPETNLYYRFDLGAGTFAESGPPEPPKAGSSAHSSNKTSQQGTTNSSHEFDDFFDERFTYKRADIASELQAKLWNQNRKSAFQSSFLAALKDPKVRENHSLIREWLSYPFVSAEFPDLIDDYLNTISWHSHAKKALFVEVLSREPWNKKPGFANWVGKVAQNSPELGEFIAREYLKPPYKGKGAAIKALIDLGTNDYRYSRMMQIIWNDVFAKPDSFPVLADELVHLVSKCFPEKRANLEAMSHLPKGFKTALLDSLKLERDSATSYARRTFIVKRVRATAGSSCLGSILNLIQPAP